MRLPRKIKKKNVWYGYLCNEETIFYKGLIKDLKNDWRSKEIVGKRKQLEHLGKYSEINGKFLKHW